jgi:hypothetical protein
MDPAAAIPAKLPQLESIRSVQTVHLRRLVNIIPERRDPQVYILPSIYPQRLGAVRCIIC